jgi:Family of unknown function (DUF5317)
MLTVYLVVGMLVLLACLRAPLSRLAGIRLRHVWLLWVALADQIVVISVVPDANPTVLAAAHNASYAIAGVWLVVNRHLPGIAMIGLGGALNGLCIVLNGGTLPASGTALRAAGHSADPGEFTNSQVLTDPRLPWLGDIFATPAWLPGNNVFSVGDIAIWIGIVLFLWRTCWSRLHPAPPVRRRDRHAAPAGVAGAPAVAPSGGAPPAAPAGVEPVADAPAPGDTAALPLTTPGDTAALPLTTPGPPRG